MKKETVESTAVAASREPGSDIAERAAENLRAKFRDMDFVPADTIRKGYEQKEDSAIETLRRHLGNDIVITKWTEADGERELEEEELFEGEVSAFIFTIGPYTVRYAECLCADSCYGPGGTRHHYSQRVPAGKDIIAEYRAVKRKRRPDEAAGTGRALVFPASRELGLLGWMFPGWKGVQIVEEVSVLRRPGNEADAECWQNICLAAQGGIWSEWIDYICTVKRGDMVSGSQEALFVCHAYLMGGMRYARESWYKITPDGKAEVYCIGDTCRGDGSEIWEL